MSHAAVRDFQVFVHYEAFFRRFVAPRVAIALFLLNFIIINYAKEKKWSCWFLQYCYMTSYYSYFKRILRRMRDIRSSYTYIR